MAEHEARRAIRALWVAAAIACVALASGAEPPADPVPGTSGASPTQDSLTLSQAVGRALGQGFLAQIARLETGQAEEGALELRGAYLPQLLIDAQAGWTNRINEKLVAGDGKTYGLDNLGNDPWIDVFVQQALVDLRLQQAGATSCGTRPSGVGFCIAYHISSSCPPDEYIA